jgi:hypothetical protein
MPPSVIESMRTATRPALAYGVPITTNCVVLKKMRAVATRRTPLGVVVTTGSRTVTPLTVCGNDDAAARVRSASVTVNEKFDDGVLVATAGTDAVTDGSGVAERVVVGLGEALIDDAVGLGRGNTTREGTHPRAAKTTARITRARTASRTSEATP